MATLYHHFGNKDGILAAVVKLALTEAPHVMDLDKPWQEILTDRAWHLRSALISHPGVIPIVATGSPSIALDLIEPTAAALRTHGLPYGLILPLIEAIELFAVSSAIHEQRLCDPAASADFSAHPALEAASHLRALAPADIFTAVVAGIIASVAGGDDGPGVAARWYDVAATKSG